MMMGGDSWREPSRRGAVAGMAALVMASDMVESVGDRPTAPSNLNGPSQMTRSFNHSSETLPFQSNFLCHPPREITPRNPAANNSPMRIKCKGSYSGNSGAALSFVGRSLLRTGQKLLKWAKEPDAGLSSFSSSALASSRHLCMPHFGMDIERTDSPSDGYLMRDVGCVGTC